MKDKVYRFSKILESTVLHKFRTGDIVRKNDIYGDFKAINTVKKYGNKLSTYIQLDCVKCGDTIYKAPTLLKNSICRKCPKPLKINNEGKLILHVFNKSRNKKEMVQGDIYKGFKAISAKKLATSKHITLECIKCNGTIVKHPFELDKMGACNSCRTIDNENNHIIKRIKTIEHGDICIKVGDKYNNLEVKGISLRGKIVLDCLSCEKEVHISATKIHDVSCSICTKPLTKEEVKIKEIEYKEEQIKKLFELITAPINSKNVLQKRWFKR